MFTGAKVFFDDESSRVIAEMDKTDLRVKKRYGGLVRTVARRSMRKVNKKGEPARPGEPPRERLGGIKRGRYGVTFGIDPTTKSLLVGPEKYPGAARRNSDTVVATLEHGGDVLVKESQRRDGSWILGQKWAKLNNMPTRERKADVEARPFMGPADAKSRPKLLAFWRDAMNK